MNAHTDDMNDKWLNDLRDRMADYREPAPENLWDDIVRASERDAAASLPPHGNVVALWLRRSAVAAMLLLALTLGYRRLSYDAPPVPDILAEIAETALDASHTVTVEAADEPTPDISAGRAIASARRIAKPSFAVGAIGSSEKTVLHTETNADKVPETEKFTEMQRKETEKHPDHSGATNIRKTQKRKTEAVERHLSAPDAKPAKTAAKGRLAADIYLSGPAGATDSHRSPGGSVMVSADRYRQVAEHADPLADPLTVIMLYNRNAPIDTEIKHRRPLRLGFSLRYMITPSTGIESGLTYALLSSSVSSGGDECYYDEDRTLHYMGIPLRLVWNAWSGKRLSLYLSGGASIEKCVAGHARTRCVLQGRTQSADRRNIRIAQPQWSASAAAGLQYDLTPRTGLYVEPGIGYYFDNGSETETIYSRRPLDFNLNMGIRISFR